MQLDVAFVGDADDQVRTAVDSEVGVLLQSATDTFDLCASAHMTELFLLRSTK